MSHLDSNSFAQKFLKRHGWKEGQGLGKSGQGIKDAIKPQLKFDTTGVGHDIAKDFTSNWWDAAFNKAAQKIQVKENEDGSVVVKAVAKKSRKEIREEKRKQRNSLYRQFVQSSTLKNGELIDVVEDEENEPEEATESLSKLTDEELFKACRGFTAHKGARHGIRMTAKRRRIAEMEAKLIREMEEKKTLCAK